jgi:hypothetical protein
VSETEQRKSLSDGAADALAATGIVTIIVIALALWLGGMPA